MRVIRFKKSSSRTSLFFVLLALIAVLGLVTAANSQGISSVYKGAVKVGEAGYFEAAGKARIGIDKYVGVSGEDLLVDVASKLPGLGDATFTFAVQVDDLDLVGFQRSNGLALLSKRVFNFTEDTVFFPNGSVEDVVVSEVNVSSVLVEGVDWEDADYRIFEWDGRTWAGVGVLLKGGSASQFKLVLRTKNFGERVKYSYLMNTSDVYVEFDPVLDDSLVHYWDLEGDGDDIFGDKPLARRAGAFLSSGGLKGQYFNMTVSDDSSLTVDEETLKNSSWTVSWWYQADEMDTASGVGFITQYQISGDDGFFMSGFTSLMRLWTDIGTYGSIPQLATPKPQWTNVLMVRNSSGMTVYLNGTPQILRSTGTIGIDVNLSFFCGGANQNCGGVSGGSIGFVGRTDEMGIWDRAFEQADADSMWNNGSGVFCTGDPCSFAGDATPPTFSGASNNGTTAKLGANVAFGINWLEDVNYKQTNFAHNDSGTLVNVVNISESGTSGTVNTSITVTSGRGSFVCGQFTLIDAAGNSNQTTLGDNTLCFTVQNTAPAHTNPVLRSTFGTNFTNENLTCISQNVADADNDAVKNITNWRLNNASIAVLNMPFERVNNTPDNNARDYSSSGNDGVENGGIVWSVDGGFDGKGAYVFDGSSTYISVADSNSLDTGGQASFEFWIKPKVASNTLYNRNVQGGGDGFHWISVTANSIGYQYANGTNVVAVASGVISWALNQWHHVVVVHNNVNKTIAFYQNGNNVGTTTYTDNALPVDSGSAFIGTYNGVASPAFVFNGSIDEVRVYNRSLSAQQVVALFNNRTNEIVSQETIAGEKYLCSITPNDGFEDGIILNSTQLQILQAITFNVSSGEDGSIVNGLDITCNSTSFSQSGDTTNPYGPFGFSPGNYQCTFTDEPAGFFHPETINFTADATVNASKEIFVVVSVTGGLTTEEHQQLEEVYACIINGNCKLFNLLLQINQTTSSTFDLVRRTDQSVVAFENQTTFIVSGSSDLEIDYTLNVPKKSGYGIVEGIQSFDDFLPMRINYWFVENGTNNCINQANDTSSSAVSPACNPLVAQTIGQIETQVNFTVKLKPSLPPGDYIIVRNLEIDPENVWINYGQEPIGTIRVLETVATPSVSLTTTGAAILAGVASGVTGAVTAATTPISISSIIIGMLTMLVIVSVSLSAYLLVTRRKKY